MFTAFIADEEVRLVGVEAGGSGIAGGHHAASLAAGRPGVLHGALSYLLQDADGQVLPTQSISAGLDYPGVGPEHSFLRDAERAEYIPVDDADAVAALRLCTKLEGILPALEPSHALHVAGGLPGRVLLCLSGRGDKDLDTLEQDGHAPD
jgi:tryptophan synthase beta chain